VGWASSAVERESYAAGAPLFEQVPQNYRILRQNIITVNQIGKLYWAGTLYRTDQPFEAGWRTRPVKDSASDPAVFSQADLLGALSAAKTYRIESLLPVISLEELRAAPAIYPDFIRRKYLRLPDKIPERVLALARDLTATAPTAYDRAKAIESYLRSTYPYTLDLPAPPGDRDVVDYFLFDLKKGYCDYYASAMAVLARAAGLPSRIVIGYASGTFNASTAKYNVTQANAHAWVEIYFSNVGWVEFEPTASQPEINRPSGDITSAGNRTPGGQPDIFSGFNAFRQNLPLFALWVLLGLAVLAFILQTGESWLLTNIPAVRAIRLMYLGLYRLGRRVAGPADAGETTSEFAALLHARLKNLSQQGLLRKSFAPAPGELNLLTSLYLRALYSPHPPEKEEIYKALRAWQALRWRLLVAGILIILNRIIRYPVRSPASAPGEET
jgi:transglutaminase-like putative cysteine protease